MLTKDPIAIIAFEGWNDAGEAASAALDHLITAFTAEKIFTFDPEPYYDFQVNRPMIRTLASGLKKVDWRTTDMYKAALKSGQILYMIRGIEPSMHWRQFTNEILDQLRNHDVSLVISLGALLSDTPHTRPIPVTPVALSSEIAANFQIELSDYEGPTGILGVIQESLITTEIPGLSLWAAVPHYVSQPPSPKASLALLDALENLIDIPIPIDEFESRVESWTRQVNDLVETDEEMQDYVRRLEIEGDSYQLPIASGETIAQEFERYLRRRDSK